jgi:hypothetical protein
VNAARLAVLAPLVYIRTFATHPLFFLTSSHPPLNLSTRYTIHINLYMPTTVQRLNSMLSMSINDLPVELFEPIVSNIVEDLGIVEAAKYRLICST